MSDQPSAQTAAPPDRHQSIPLGVVFERRRIGHPWQEWCWQPIAVIPGAAPCDEPRLLRAGEGWAWLLLATLPLELFVGETRDYRVNLSQVQPQVYVLWRPDADEVPEPFHVTVCHSETQDYLDGGDVMAAGVPMPEAVAALLAAYVAAYHVETPFRKRKRTPLVARPDGEDDDG